MPTGRPSMHHRWGKTVRPLQSSAPAHHREVGLMNPNVRQSREPIHEAGASAVNTMPVWEHPRETSTAVATVISNQCNIVIMYRTGTLLGRMSNECPPRYVRRNDVYRSLCTIATPNVADDGHSPTFVRRYLQFNSVLYVPRPGGLVAADRVAGFSLWLSSCMSVTYEAPHRSRWPKLKIAPTTTTELPLRPYDYGGPADLHIV